jgi:hypothetical protein
MKIKVGGVLEMGSTGDHEIIGCDWNRRRQTRGGLLHQTAEETMQLTDIPAEILVYIFSYLPCEGLASISQACRLFHFISQSADSLWRPHCSPLPTFSPFKSWRQLFISRWYKWNWALGIWCGDRPYGGKLFHHFTHDRIHDGLCLQCQHWSL